MSRRCSYRRDSRAESVEATMVTAIAGSRVRARHCRRGSGAKLEVQHRGEDHAVEAEVLKSTDDGPAAERWRREHRARDRGAAANRSRRANTDGPRRG